MNEIATRDTREIAPVVEPEKIAKGAAVLGFLHDLDAKMFEDYTQSDFEMLDRVWGFLDVAERRGPPEACLVELRKLKAFKPRRRSDENEWAFVAKTLAVDLARYPFWAVQMGCDRYRRRADLEFFPDTAEEIVNLMAKERRKWRQVAETIGRVTPSHIADPGKMVSQKEVE